MYRNDKVIRRYSEPFKLKILAELSTGNTPKVNFVNFIPLRQQLLMCGLKSMSVKI